MATRRQVAWRRRKRKLLMLRPGLVVSLGSLTVAVAVLTEHLAA